MQQYIYKDRVEMYKEIHLWYDNPQKSNHTPGVLPADTRTGGCSKSKPPVYPELKQHSAQTGHNKRHKSNIYSHPQKDIYTSSPLKRSIYK